MYYSIVLSAVIDYGIIVAGIGITAFFRIVYFSTRRAWHTLLRLGQEKLNLLFVLIIW